MKTKALSYWATFMHLLQWSPFLIVLLCPLMHFFMHSGHRHKTEEIPDTSNLDYQRGYTDALSETAQQDSVAHPEQEASRQSSVFR